MLPTISKAPSAAPTTSFAPTSCSLVNVGIIYDSYASEISWEFAKVADGENSEVVHSHQVSYDTVVDSEMWSVCLEDGQYNFTIYDSACDGIFFPGLYNVTASDWTLIATGYNYTCSESTLFSLPYPAAPRKLRALTARHHSMLRRARDFVRAVWKE